MHPGRVPAQNHVIVARFVSFTTSLGLRLIAVFALLWGDDATACTRTDDSFTAERERMVEAQLADREIKDSRVLAAMRALPRHLFVPAPGHRTPTTIVRFRSDTVRPSRSRTSWRS
jgi:hypothetical protein